MVSGFGPGARIFRLESRGVRTRVVQEGSGKDIVWIPGGDAAAEYWTGMFPFFIGSFRCTSYDPRGIGEAAAPPPPWTIADFARDCAAVIEATCSPPVVLVGLSMGSLIAQQVAIDHPHLLRLAIPMGTAARISGFTRDWMQAEIDFRAGGRDLPPDFAACHYAAFAYPAAALGDEAIWRKVKSAYEVRFGSRDPEQLIAQWQACLDFDCRDALADCTTPIHAVAFAEDIQTPPSMVREVAERSRNGTFHQLPGLGHVSFSRHRPEVVAELLREIIDGRYRDTGK